MEARVADMIAEQMRIQRGQRPSASELRSWGRSLPVLHADLMDAGLGGVEMLIEYQLPLSSKRADVVLAGHHPRTGAPSYVVVELKQWSHAHVDAQSPHLATVEGFGGTRLHPRAQVSAYCEYLRDFNGYLAQPEVQLSGVAYLHNARDHDVSSLLAGVPGEQSNGEVFTGQRRGAFIDYLRRHLSPDEAGTDAADALLAARLAPSKALLAVAAGEVQEREQFVLLDEQKVAFELVVQAVARARRSQRKTAVVVTGGPGSGKSVIALSLLGELSRQGRTVVHATGSRSFTVTLRRVAGRRNPRVAKLFRYFNQFTDAEANDLECLILDEAHRIRATSVNRYTPKAARQRARPQVDELLAAARVPVFLLDQHQVVRPGEMGTPQEIRRSAAAMGMDVEFVALDSQFRCGGSAAYVDWVQSMLGLSPGARPQVWPGDGLLDVSVVESPQEMETRLERHHVEGYTSRMAAGYCWPWSDADGHGRLVPDVHIGDWARPWNVKGDRATDGAPPAALWATDPAGFGQVGCVYTAQGFEYDYAGVILGPDFVWRDDAWSIVREANKDPDFRNRSTVPDDLFAQLVRNVYKVLLTRGMRGVYLYSTDAQTQQRLRDLVRVDLDTPAG